MLMHLNNKLIKLEFFHSVSFEVAANEPNIFTRTIK